MKQSAHPCAGANFSDAAPTYEQHARFQQDAAIQFQKFIRRNPPETTPKHVLELGCGTGLLTRLLPGLFPTAAICASDLSSPMLKICEQNLREVPALRYALYDFDRDEPALDTPFDLVVSGMAMQWSRDLFRTLNRLAAASPCPNLHFYLSFPLNGTFRPLRLFFKKEGLPYPGLELPGESELRALLASIPGAAIRNWENCTLEETFDSLPAFLHTLQRTGTGNATGNPVPAGVLRRLFREYPGAVQMNYEYSLINLQIIKENQDL